MGNDFHDLSDKKFHNILFSLEDNSGLLELENIFDPASKQWGPVLLMGTDTRILASQIPYLLQLLDEHPNREHYDEFYEFLKRCQYSNIDLKISAD